MKLICALIVSVFASMAFATATITLTNTKAGEKATYYINSGASALLPVGAHTVLANLTGSTALPTAASYAAIQSALGISALQNGTFTLSTETVSAAGALSTTLAESKVTNASGSTFAVTLAAPSSQDGQTKIIVATTSMVHTVTLALTNVQMSGAYTPSGTTTLTFTSVGDTAVFVAVGSKWVYLGGSAVAS